MKKYIKVLSDGHCLALTIILLIGLGCLMATSEWTWLIIAIKAVGFGMLWLYFHLYKRWSTQGKTERISDLFNDIEKEG